VEKVLVESIAGSQQERQTDRQPNNIYGRA